MSAEMDLKLKRNVGVESLMYDRGDRNGEHYRGEDGG